VQVTYLHVNGLNVLQFDKNDPDTLVGVIARSAGVWDSKCFSRFFPIVDFHTLELRQLTLATQTIRPYARAPARRCGRRERNSAIEACCESMPR
jgi:hypothetical protein